MKCVTPAFGRVRRTRTSQWSYAARGKEERERERANPPFIFWTPIFPKIGVISVFFIKTVKE